MSAGHAEEQRGLPTPDQQTNVDYTKGTADDEGHGVAPGMRPGRRAEGMAGAGSLGPGGATVRATLAVPGGPGRA